MLPRATVLAWGTIGLLVAPAAAAEPWSVCPGGTCDFDTISACAGAALAGETCLVQPGVYHETVTSGSNYVTGVVVACATPRACVVDGDGDRQYGFTVYKDWEIEGFEIRNTRSSAFAGTPSRFLAAVRDCWVHDVGGYGISHLSATAVVERNVVERTWASGIAGGGTIVNNLVVDAAIGSGSGIEGAAGAVVAHNTVDVRKTAATYGISGATARYNLTLGGLYGVYASSASQENTAWDADTAFAGAAPGTGDVEAEPLFVGPEDYHLAASILASTSTGLLVDGDGDPRDEPPDRGAFEYDPGDVPAPPRLVAEEVVATPTQPARPVLVQLPGGGPAVAWFDAADGTLSWAVRTAADTWTRQDIHVVEPPYSPLVVFQTSLDLAVDPVTGHPSAAWLEDAGTLVELHTARFVGGGCGSGCDAADWEGCGDTPLLTMHAEGQVEMAFDPVDGSPWIAVISPSGVACGGGRYADVLDLFHLDDAGWTVQTLVDPGCTDRLGAALGLSVDPLVGAAEVVFTRVPAIGGEATLYLATAPLDAAPTVAPVPLPQGWVPARNTGNRAAVQHDDAGDLHLVFTAELALTGSVAYLVRVDGTWSDPAWVDGIAATTVPGSEGMDLALDTDGRVVGAWSLHEASRAVVLGDLDASLSFMHVEGRTGWWTTVAPIRGDGVGVAAQGYAPSLAITYLATADPGVGVPGPGLGEGCTSADPCNDSYCDTVLGCVVDVVDCDDGNPCTDDTCLGGGACDHADNTDPCDDGDPDTIADTCAAGTCAGVPALLTLDLAESVVVGEARELLPELRLQVEESVQIGDAVEPTPGLVLAVAEEVQIGEERALAPGLFLDVAETVRIGEGPALAPGLFLDLAEAVRIGDAVAPLPGLLLDLGEEVSVADGPGFEPGLFLDVEEVVVVGDEAGLDPGEAPGRPICHTGPEGPRQAWVLLLGLALLRRRDPLRAC